MLQFGWGIVSPKLLYEGLGPQLVDSITVPQRMYTCINYLVVVETVEVGYQGHGIEGCFLTF